MLVHQTESPPKVNHAILLVFCCTFIGAAAQVFLKFGAAAVARPTPIQLLFNLPLLLGYSLYGVSTGLFVLALRRGQLSVVYPVISLTYVWVALLSIIIFQESMNLFKAVGLAVVVAGVAVLGRDARS